MKKTTICIATACLLLSFPLACDGDNNLGSATIGTTRPTKHTFTIAELTSALADSSVKHITHHNPGTLTAPMVWNKPVYQEPGAVITQSAVNTLTVNVDNPSNGRWQRFAPAAGLRLAPGTVYPEWLGLKGDANGTTENGTDNTLGLKILFSSLSANSKVVFSGLYRVRWPGLSATYPYVIAQVPSNTEICSSGGGSGIFHDYLGDNTSYSSGEYPFVFAVWGAVENISIHNMYFLGRSDHTYNGKTSGTPIGISTIYHTGTAGLKAKGGQAYPSAQGDAPKNISISDNEFVNGREAIHVDGWTSNHFIEAVYTPENIKIDNNVITDFEHGIGVMLSVRPVSITRTRLYNKTWMQRGIAVWGSRNLTINDVSFGPTGANSTFASGIMIAADDEVTRSGEITIKGVKTDYSIKPLIVLLATHGAKLTNISINNITSTDGSSINIYPNAKEGGTKGDISNIKISSAVVQSVNITNSAAITLRDIVIQELVVTASHHIRVNNSKINKFYVD